MKHLRSNICKCNPKGVSNEIDFQWGVCYIEAPLICISGTILWLFCFCEAFTFLSAVLKKTQMFIHLIQDARNILPKLFAVQSNLYVAYLSSYSATGRHNYPLKNLYTKHNLKSVTVSDLALIKCNHWILTNKLTQICIHIIICEGHYGCIWVLNKVNCRTKQSTKWHSERW